MSSFPACREIGVPGTAWATQPNPQAEACTAQNAALKSCAKLCAIPVQRNGELRIFLARSLRSRVLAGNFPPCPQIFGKARTAQLAPRHNLRAISSFPQ
jgi:hypothetical protein